MYATSAIKCTNRKGVAHPHAIQTNRLTPLRKLAANGYFWYNGGKGEPTN